MESPADEIVIPAHHPVLSDGARFSLAIIGIFAAVIWAECTNPFHWNGATNPDWFRYAPCTPIVLTVLIDTISVVIALVLVMAIVQLVRDT